MYATNVFNEDLIFNNLTYENREDLLRQLARKLYEKGLVKESFIDAIVEREKVYPTGLPTEGYGVAIPHTDTIHVNQSGVAVCVLDKPVKFVAMGTDGELIDVKYIFMLSVDTPHGHIEMLSKLSEIFQSESRLKELANLNIAEIHEKLNYYIQQ